MDAIEALKSLIEVKVRIKQSIQKHLFDRMSLFLEFFFFLFFKVKWNEIVQATDGTFFCSIDTDRFNNINSKNFINLK